MKNVNVIIAVIGLIGLGLMLAKTFLRRPALAGLGGEAALDAGGWQAQTENFVTGGTGVESYNLQDDNLQLTLALPAGNATTVTAAAGIDLGETTANAVTPANWELLLAAPAIAATGLPTGATLTYAIIAADNAALSGNVTTLHPSLIVQTGVANAAAAAKARYKLPSVCQRYIGFTITSSDAATGNLSALSATLTPVF